MVSSISGLRRLWSVQGCLLRQEGEAGVPGVPGVRSALGEGVYTWLVENSSGHEGDGVTGRSPGLDKRVWRWKPEEPMQEKTLVPRSTLQCPRTCRRLESMLLCRSGLFRPLWSLAYERILVCLRVSSSSYGGRGGS